MSADNMSMRESQHEDRMIARELQDAINAAEYARRCEACGKPSNDVCEYVQGEFVCRACAPGMALFLVGEAQELSSEPPDFVRIISNAKGAGDYHRRACDIAGQITSAYAILRWMHPEAAKSHAAEVARAVANDASFAPHACDGCPDDCTDCADVEEGE